LYENRRRKRQGDKNTTELWRQNFLEEIFFFKMEEEENYYAKVENSIS